MVLSNNGIYLILKNTIHGDSNNDNNNDIKKKKTFKKNDIKKAPDPSPKTMKKNLSTDNFMKFQWSWTL